ncbi:MAG TPA: hypothetical protein VE074_13915 [Jatrophihabitantaceae bacterium]|nr:hypothetical protein [Jatrophihabitantaceae bacterium]
MLLAALGADGEALTLRQAGDQVQMAIDFGTIAAQQAPAGHPIYAALDDAREAKAWIEDKIPWFSADGPALPTVSARVDQAVAAVYDAAATLRTPSDVPTTYAAPSSPPWAWIGAGLAALAGTFVLFRERRQ